MKFKFLFSATLIAQLAQPALAAEEEVLLTITGDRIELISDVQPPDDADDLVLRYYQLLPLALQESLQLLRHQSRAPGLQEPRSPELQRSTDPGLQESRAMCQVKFSFSAASRSKSST